MPPRAPSDSRAVAERLRLAAYAEIFADGGDPAAEAAMRARLALALADDGEILRAIGELRRALAVGWKTASDEERAQGLLVLATLLVRAGRATMARRLVEQSAATWRAQGREDGLAACALVEALAARVDGDRERARRLLHRARDGFVAAGRPGWAGHALMDLGEIERDDGRFDVAALCFATAHGMFEIGGAIADAARAAATHGDALVAAGQPEAGASWLSRARTELLAGGGDAAVAATYGLRAVHAWLDGERPDEARAAFAALDDNLLAEVPALAAAAARRLAAGAFARGEAVEAQRFLERALRHALADGTRDVLVALLDVWVTALVDGKLQRMAWARLGDLALQLDAAGHADLAALCREAGATLR